MLTKAEKEKLLEKLHTYLDAYIDWFNRGRCGDFDTMCVAEAALYEFIDKEL